MRKVIKDYKRNNNDLPRKMICQVCGAEFIGTRGARYCKPCRVIAYREHRALGVRIDKKGKVTQKAPEKMITATCPHCGAKHEVPAKSSTKWVFCSKCEYLRGVSYEPEHRVIW